MASIDDNEPSTLSNIDNINIPVSSDNIRLKWNGNDATILGLLHETGLHYTKVGLFQTLLENRSVALSNGRLAVDDPNTVYFVSGQISDERSFSDPCPPTVERLSKVNELAAALGAPETPSLTAVPDEFKSTVIFAPHCIKQESSKLLTSLVHVFGHAEPSEALIEEAAGNGLKFLQILRDRGANADARDRALEATKFANIVRNGVPGELNLTSFAAFLKTYKAGRRNVPPASRPSPEAEVEMISVIAIADAASRELYELKVHAKPPKTLEEASTVLMTMLRGRVRCEEIDQLRSGAPSTPALAATAAPAAAPAGANTATSILTALAASGVDVKGLNADVLTALVSALAPADPRKSGAGREKEKVKVPRGDDGKPLKWVPGMATCRCGVNGGKHLFRDCPKKKEKEEKKALAAKAAADATAKSGITAEQLQDALAAFFSEGSSSAGSAPASVKGE